MGEKMTLGPRYLFQWVTVSPESLTVTENQTATLHCSATGNPAPTVSWEKIHESFNEDLGTTYSHESKLEVWRPGYNSLGQYRCIGRNVHHGLEEQRDKEHRSLIMATQMRICNGPRVKIEQICC